MFVLISRTQAGPDRTVKQEQEESSRNHVQTFISPSVKQPEVIISHCKSYLIVRQVQDLERLEPDEGVCGEEVAGDGVPGEVEEDEAAEALEDARREEGEAVVAQGELAQRRRRVEEGRRQGRQLRDDQIAC